MSSQESTQSMPTKRSTSRAESSGSRRTNILIALLAVLAIAGIGFGIFGLIETNNKVSKISNLEAQLEEAQGHQSERSATPDQQGTATDGGNAEASPAALKNLVITNTSNGGIYRPQASADWYVGSKNTQVGIMLEEGSVAICLIGVANCSVRNIPGRISKVESISINHYSSLPTPEDTGLAFILEDGQVYYFLGSDLKGDNVFEAKKLPVDNFVVDLEEIDIIDSNTGRGHYSTTLVVFSDGSYKELGDMI